MSLVVDASATIAFVHPQETTREIEQVFRTVSRHGAWAPLLWKAEVANVLQMQVRRGHYGVAERDRILQQLEILPVQLDVASTDFLWTTTVVLAHRHNLTMYDAIYLELALRRGLPLATLDRDLRTAAAREGVPLLGL